MTLAWIGVLALGLAGSGASPSLKLAKGRVNEGIACLRDATQTYSVYVPRAYDPARSQPALLVFDPRGRGTFAAEIFRPAAERFGWLVVSSNDTRSDGTLERNMKALAALWPEVNERYASDPKRIYAAGFSGGGVLALLLGLQTGGLAGVIDCGGRLPEGAQLEKAAFAHYGAAGRFDFNHLDMSEVDAFYARLGRPHRLEEFEGAHEWMPPGLAQRALAWLEVVAMKDGARPRDDEIVRGLFADDLDAAARLEQSARWLEAARLYESMLASFEGLHPLDEARAGLKRSAADGRLEAARREQRRADDLERQARRRMAAAFDGLRFAEGPISLAAFRGPARIDELRKDAAGTGVVADAARRALEMLFVQASFYVPKELLARGERAKAALALQLATELRPESAFAHYSHACALARLGDRKGALAALERAVANGFNNVEQLGADTDLEPLRGDARYHALLKRLREALPETAQPPTPPS
jgi:predicted esterase